MRILKTAALVIGAITVIASGGAALAGAGFFGASAQAAAVAGTGLIGSLSTIAAIGAIATAGLPLAAVLPCPPPEFAT